MRLYTICIQQRPIVVMSADAQSALPDKIATNPAFLNALRATEKIRSQSPADVLHFSERMEIEKAINTWLGADFQTLEHDGSPLWGGEWNDIAIREARADEAERWYASRRTAIDNNEVDAGDEDWLVYLVSVSDPTDDAFDKDDD